MRATSVPHALRERLGHEGTIGLMELVDAEHAEWSERLMNIFIERFERRLAARMGGLRRARGGENHETRSETSKGQFLFWATQLAALVGLLVFIFRNSAR